MHFTKHDRQQVVWIEQTSLSYCQQEHIRTGDLSKSV